MTNTRVHVTPTQLYMLFSQYLFTTILGFRESTLVDKAGFAVWLPLIIGSLAGLFLTFFSYRLAMKRPTRFFGQYGQEIVGKWLHYPLVITMIFSFLFSAAFVLRELQDFMVEVFLPDTPEWAVTSLFSVCVAYAVRSGVQTIFRCAQGIFFLTLFGILLIPIFVMSEMNWDMAIAFLNHFDKAEIGKTSYFVASLYGQMGYILFFFPFFSEPRKTMKSLTLATVTSLLIVFSNLLPAILIFGPNLTSNMSYPELELIRYIRAGYFLENLDPVLIAIWLTSLFVKISMFLYVAVIALTHTLSLNDHKPLSLSMSAIMVGMALFMVKTGTELDHLLAHGEIMFLIVTESIPILYLIVDHFRSRWKNA
ncbi:GerAB/ArcD/ProY family transporter [Brevibacillus sp. NRS-1366]|uniref:GerAB/ArcD/ProY family transporter n=1 Tax=Brevibacillus sp. NRS-1366 TaxID=3233899 RepID=UPI003D246C7B